MTCAFDLAGRKALVTGGGSGLGFAIARGLARAGAQVTINGRNAQKLDAAAAQLASEGSKLRVMTFDVRDRAAVRAAVAELERATGAIDILVNNAAVNKRGAFDDFAETDWHELDRKSTRLNSSHANIS